jgi:hypothetical protein
MKKTSLESSGGIKTLTTKDKNGNKY